MQDTDDNLNLLSEAKLMEIHDERCHCGTERLKEFINRKFGVDISFKLLTDVKNKCRGCALVDKRTNISPLTPPLIATELLEKVVIDVMYLPITSGGVTAVLMGWGFPLLINSAAHVVVMDSGSEFQNDLLNELL
eukprot:Awhi_evm1s12032